MTERNFKIPDPDMFESGRTMRQLFLNHKDPFVAKDATIDAPFEDDWLASILASETWESDESRTDQQEQETDDVLIQMEKGRKSHAQMKYYIDAAFENKPAIKKKFGLDDYAEAATNQPRMVTFLRKMHTECEVPAQKALLLAKGCTQLQIDALEALADNLAAENTEQNTFIQESPKATKARIEQYNSTYAFAQRVNRLSKSVYYGDTVMLNIFNLPEGTGPDPDINVKGKVTDGATGNPLKNVEVKLLPLEIVTKTTFYGNYNYVSIPPGNYTLRYLLAGYGQVDHPITVLADGVVTDNAVLNVV